MALFRSIEWLKTNIHVWLVLNIMPSFWKDTAKEDEEFKNVNIRTTKEDADFKNLDIFPKSGIFIAVTGLLVIFLWSHSNGHVTAYVPLLSEIGSDPPESRLFTLVLCVSSVLGTITVVLVYWLYREWDKRECAGMAYTNECALTSGLVSLLGMVMVALFPLKDWSEIHVLGGFLLFNFFLIYATLDVILSYHFCPQYVSKSIYTLRWTLLLLAAGAGTSCVVCGLTGYYIRGIPFNQNWTPKKVPGDQGFTLLLLSGLGQWIMTACYLVLLATHIVDLKKMEIILQVKYHGSVPRPPVKSKKTKSL